MGWGINNNRLSYENVGRIIYPSAEEIFLLKNGRKIYPFAEHFCVEHLGIHFSRLGARICVQISFEFEHNEIIFELYAKRGEKTQKLEYRNGDLPDSIVVDNSWYSLLSNYDEIKRMLDYAQIYSSGMISLKQYILLKKISKMNMDSDVLDFAESELSNHLMKGIKVERPVSLQAELYPYQQQGYQWMRFIAAEKCGCILGDEMGLGKTLQVIALIADRYQNNNGPALVVAPVSLLENWKREFEKFTRGINVLIHHGAQRTGLFAELMRYDVVIISYNTACSDQSLLKMINWDLLVVDEAQNIKNPLANRTRCIKAIPRHISIAVTGTPFENHISDLWSLMDFIVPGCFGTLASFEAVYQDDLDGAEAIEPILSPIMIRRKVADVAKDLPERVNVPQILRMRENEIQAYEIVRQKVAETFDGHNAALPMLQKLRMYCTHPWLLADQTNGDPGLVSSKYERLCEILEEINLLGEKAILFTSYNKMFDILQNDIPQRFGIKVMSINGSTSVEERQIIIDKFSDIVGSALLILNPRAAGAGLNITAASRVIHYNPEWNPALEDQASARAYRRGQTKTVFIYRLYYKDTVETIINERNEKKRNMFGAAVKGTDGTFENNMDIIRALMISPKGEKDGKQA